MSCVFGVCVCVCVCVYVYLYENESTSHSIVSNSLRPHGLYSPWNSPGQNTGVGSLSLLHGIFPTQGSNPVIPHCRQIIYQLSHKKSPRILEWVAYPISNGSSQPRNWTGVSCLAGGFFTNWAMMEALIAHMNLHNAQCHKSFSLCCLLGVLVLHFTLMSINHFELIFWGV